jgi:hypothetical protein
LIYLGDLLLCRQEHQSRIFKLGGRVLVEGVAVCEVLLGACEFFFESLKALSLCLVFIRGAHDRPLEEDDLK